jgi:aldose 1-epimerase
MRKNNYSQYDCPKNTKSFGLLPDGKEVYCYTLTNKNGMELDVINYGATITSIKIPVANQEKIDVVLGLDTLQAYIESINSPNAPYFGCVVGRYAGRINEGTFILNGKTIQLHKNHGNHHLHGGNEGLSKQFWSLKNRIEGESPSITLQYISKNEEENYPGILMVEVTYILTAANQVIIEYHAHSTEDTILNLTQHSYFNLEGHKSSIENHSLHVNATKILETDTLNIPTGKVLHTANCPFDFTEQKKCPISIDTTFIIDQKAKIAASLYSDNTKINMKVATNQPAVHIYVGGNCFGMVNGKENASYHSKSGICFETQNFPDAPNHAHFPSAVLKKGESYHHQTIFSFEHIN